MFDEQGLRDDHRRILKEIQIVRRPYLGIVAGYHELGYRVLGPEAKRDSGSVQISGRLMVSPKLIWTPAQAQKTFGDLFEEREIMDANLVGRVFAFPAVAAGSFNLQSEHLTITRHEWSPEVLMEKVLEELLRQEETRTAVLRTPDIRFYPLAVQRFIHEILGEEFA
ncbi:MAG: hypothetical protein HYZ11_13595 [Candidatus Tectomicrobia bacterium]|uniref:Uncharacterized protein n=1 Tax=Tectimicrobiota bacterium TaxID=2528274 RepID=A0A932I0C8_UNCTE|nr:hypothetical protein [Candidatus Tectomicrobia bacterium]